MKETLVIFVIIFLGSLSTLYLFGTDRDIPGMVVVSAVTAAIMALMNRFLKKYAIIAIKKIVKRIS